MPNPRERSASDYIPTGRITLPVLSRAAQSCRGCDLYKRATQAVFGEGPRTARILMVGEQPGDQEDLRGRPFVGPAGRLLDRALAEAGIARADVNLTNAVKHFKWEPRGKKRLHAKPSAREVKACRPWLEAEIGLIRPSIVVALGATAAQTLLGPGFRLTQHRGEFLKGTVWAPLVAATVHPSAILRAPDSVARREALDSFIADLRLVARRLSGGSTAVPGRSAKSKTPSGRSGGPRLAPAKDPPKLPPLTRRS